ncbi:glutamine synthetase [Paraliobacillus quinghaiensis]|uniref:Glutamine synthetase n=1 Tax=Paraliobacillus quinghaiensis TaxID=470815 RepID=A0A917TJU9_9BACI|nr:type I glutamate--ammonia ligase [Paraliobacillus quinghaiensis]GGM26131.1 glutamine synthetase [Paraliobacillus quinghaiensis]
MNREYIVNAIKEENVEFIRLEFTDLLGDTKNVEVPVSEIDAVLEKKVMFDSSSIVGFTSIEASDMNLHPDLETFNIVPPALEGGESVARFICDIYTPEGEPFKGDPRSILKRALKEASDLGYDVKLGPEPEFFLFQKDERGYHTNELNDRAGYFDTSPFDRGETCRRNIAKTLQKFGFVMEASHKEVANGQHEINWRFDSGLNTADKIQTFKYVVRNIAANYNMHATFMPKPLSGQNGSGMHINISLFKDNKNAFFDENKEDKLSETARYFISGVLKHAKALTAITNPTINSYKRLVPGYEAPVSVAWSHSNRSCMIRIPATRGQGTRFEVRSPDPTANPYLAIAALIYAGLYGIKEQYELGPVETRNLFEVESDDVPTLPTNLKEAIEFLKKDNVISDALGKYAFQKFIEEKEDEWLDYNLQVTEWERKKYMSR